MNNWAAVLFVQDNWRHSTQWQYYSVRLWADAEELCQIQVEGERERIMYTLVLCLCVNDSVSVWPCVCVCVSESHQCDGGGQSHATAAARPRWPCAPGQDHEPDPADRGAGRLVSQPGPRRAGHQWEPLMQSHEPVSSRWCQGAGPAQGLQQRADARAGHLWDRSTCVSLRVWPVCAGVRHQQVMLKSAATFSGSIMCKIESF